MRQFAYSYQRIRVPDGAEFPCLFLASDREEFLAHIERWNIMNPECWKYRANNLHYEQGYAVVEGWGAYPLNTVELFRNAN